MTEEEYNLSVAKKLMYSIDEKISGIKGLMDELKELQNKTYFNFTDQEEFDFGINKAFCTCYEMEDGFEFLIKRVTKKIKELAGSE